MKSTLITLLLLAFASLMASAQVKQPSKKQKKKAQAYVQNLVDIYKYKFGMTPEAYKAYNPETDTILSVRPVRQRDIASYNFESAVRKGPNYMLFSNGKLKTYNYVIKNIQKEHAYDALFDSLKIDIAKNIPETYLYRPNKSERVNGASTHQGDIVIAVPGTQASIIYGHYDFQGYSVLRICFNSPPGD